MMLQICFTAGQAAKGNQRRIYGVESLSFTPSHAKAKAQRSSRPDPTRHEAKQDVHFHLSISITFLSFSTPYATLKASGMKSVVFKNGVKVFKLSWPDAIRFAMSRSLPGTVGETSRTRVWFPSSRSSKSI